MLFIICHFQSYIYFLVDFLLYYLKTLLPYFWGDSPKLIEEVLSSKPNLLDYYSVPSLEESSLIY